MPDRQGKVAVHHHIALERHESARSRGKSIGGATVTDDTMLALALHGPGVLKLRPGAK